MFPAPSDIDPVVERVAVVQARRRRRRRAAVRWAAAALLCALAACTSVSPYYDPAQPHRTARGFENNYHRFEPKGLAAVLRWRLAAWRDGLPRPPRVATPQVAADLAFIHSNAQAGTGMQPAVTWIGHASVLAQLGGLNVLTDPIFSQRASPLAFVGPRRQVPPGVTLGDLPHIDVVLISHDHYDHLDAASIDALARQPGGAPLFVVPLGVARWFADRGIAGAIELDWWQSRTVAGPMGAVEVALTPAQHWSGRGLADRKKTLWGGYAVFAPDCHLYYSGDSGYSPDFADIRARYAGRQRPAQGGGFDLAILSIGAYEPRWFMREQHADPAEMVQIQRDLGAKRSLGVHWGTFQLSDESLDAPPPAYAAARRAAGLADDAAFVLAIGETRRLPRR
jgi:N-acyl-phosphatidylethanolamine-hydrolysing phospholipase D